MFLGGFYTFCINVKKNKCSTQKLQHLQLDHNCISVQTKNAYNGTFRSQLSQYSISQQSQQQVKVDNLYISSKRSRSLLNHYYNTPLVHWTHAIGCHIRRVDMKALARYQIILLGEQRHIGVNNLPKVVARQWRGRESNPRSTDR